jgi:hypothetical protein
MLVVGTPRPSGVLGDIADNGFFESRAPDLGAAAEFDDDLNDALSPSEDASRGARARSESFHEKFNDEGDKAVNDVQMLGKQTLLQKQLEIVTALETHKAQDSPEAMEEQQLDALEASSLKAWSGPGGKGKSTPAGASAPRQKSWGRRRSSLSKSLVVHTGPAIPDTSSRHRLAQTASATAQVEAALLPAYEERVSVAVLGSARAFDWSYNHYEFCGRRVRCEVWDVPDALAVEFVKTCQVCVVEWNASAEATSRRLVEALQRPIDLVLALRGKGKPSAQAKTLMRTFGAFWLAPGSALDFVVCQAALHLAKQRGENQAVLDSLTAQLKRLKGNGSCSLM